MTLIEILKRTKRHAQGFAEMILWSFAISLCGGAYFYFQFQVWEPRCMEVNLSKGIHRKGRSQSWSHPALPEHLLWIHIIGSCHVSGTMLGPRADKDEKRDAPIHEEL